MPSSVIPSNSIPVQISPGASSSGGVKRTNSESTALPSVPGAMSGSDVKCACSESIARPNLPGASSRSGLKRAHEKGTANDNEEQPGARAWISTLIAGLHGVDAAEDDEMCNGDEVHDEWLSSWYPETHMSQKIVIEAERKEMERFKRMKVYRVVTRESMKRDEEGKMISIKWGHHKQKEQKSIQLPRHVW